MTAGATSIRDDKEAIRVLLIEDNPGDVDLVKERIETDMEARGERQTVCIDSESSLAEALDRIAATQPDLILADLNLPDSTGIDTFDRVRAAAPDTPIIVVTGNEDVALIEACIARGAQDYLVKGTSMPLRVDTIYNTVLRARTTRALAESHENLKRVLANSRDAVVVVNENAEVMFANQAARALFEERIAEGQKIGMPLGTCRPQEVDVPQRGGTVRSVEMCAGETIWFGERARVVTFRDVTERNVVKDAVQRERDFAEHLIDTAQVIVLLLDTEGRIVRFNRYMEALSGYRLDEVRGRDWFNTFLPEGRREVTRALFTKAIGDVNTRGSIDGLMTRDGEERLIEWYDSPLRDEQGIADGLLCIGQDVTDRVLAERRLRENRAFLNSLLEAIPVPVFYKDTDCRYLGVNPAFATFFGKPRDYLVGKTVSDISPSELAEVYEAKDRALLETGGSQTYEFIVRAADGERRNAIFNKAVFHDDQGHSLGLVGALQDITEQKRYQATIQAEKEKAQQYLDIAAVMLLGLDLDGRITLINRCGCDILGRSQEEIMGTAWIDFIPQKEREKVKGLLERILAGEVDIAKRMEGTVLTAAGEERSMVWHNAVVRDASGTITGTLSSGEDVTERRQIQAQLAQSDRLSSMGMLAAGVAHEINNPLSYVLYNLDSSLEDLPEIIDAMRTYQNRVAEHFGRAEVDAVVGSAADKMNPAMLEDISNRFKDALEGTRRIRQISRSLGTFARVETDELVPVKLMHVIEVAINMAFNEIKYRARLVKNYGRVRAVYASEGRLSQVFLNLIINAAHAIGDGDVENNEIRITTFEKDDHVCAEVCDTGEGIEPAHLEKLFEPFFTTKQIGVGSGLGLAISKNIVEGYGGTIEVTSELGKGTCFVVRLPIQSEHAPLENPTSEQPPPDAVYGRILVVDDEEAIRDIMLRMLRGHDTVVASSGAEAKQIIEADQAFDLILCDMMMPEVSGMDVHKWLSEMNSELADRVVFISGGAFTPRARAYLSKVGNIRLEKPFDVANFKKIVGELIKSGKRSSGTT